MKTFRSMLITAAIAGSALSSAWVAQAVGLSAADVAKGAGTITPQAANNQTAVACNLCFTCGGDWTVFAGSFTSVGNNPTERGSGCSGTLTTRSDTRPFLCCR